jgi:hypothetical protein
MPEDAMVSLKMADGAPSSRSLWQVRARQVIEGVPWRMTRSVRGQAHFPGFFWSATMSGHVIYESRLELARLLLADFDRGVAAIAAQPFLLRAQVGGRTRRHVPDFLLVHADRSVRVVNVKPAERLADPKVAEALAWPGELFGQHGWEYEIWTGGDPVFLRNVRFLAGYRRPGMVPGPLLAEVIAAVGPGTTIGEVARGMPSGRDPGGIRAAVLRLLWEQRLVTDLHRPLDADSVLEAAS